jgi:hypothetical protein
MSAVAAMAGTDDRLRSSASMVTRPSTNTMRATAACPYVVRSVVSKRSVSIAWATERPAA